MNNLLTLSARTYVFIRITYVRYVLCVDFTKYSSEHKQPRSVQFVWCVPAMSLKLKLIMKIRDLI